MSVTTYTLPTGEKRRCASARRFVLFLDYGAGAYIEARSDSYDTIATKAIRAKRNNPTRCRAFVGMRHSGTIREV